MTENVFAQEGAEPEAVAALAETEKTVEQPQEEIESDRVFAAEESAEDGIMVAAQNVIPDVEFQKIINKSLKRAEETPITVQDMEQLESLRLIEQDTVKSIEGIQYGINIKDLSIEQAGIEDLRLIKTLPNIKTLILHRNTVDLAWMQDMETLSTLMLSFCDVVGDFGKLGNKPNLERLYFSSTNIESLNGLTPEKFPQLQQLELQYNKKLKDISALSAGFESLKVLDLKSALQSGYNITDITPIKANPNITYLDLSHVYITDQNRQSYRDVIRSLVNLKYLNLSCTKVTDEDIEMLSTLHDLSVLLLNENFLTNAEFCAKLPKTMKELALSNNKITDMSPLKVLQGLECLEFGRNNITDLSFIASFPALTNKNIDVAEGTEQWPVKQYYEFSKKGAPTFLDENKTVTVQNPYIGVDGNPVSFENAVINAGNGCTVRYDAKKNEIIFENVSEGAVGAYVRYDIVVGDGSKKIANLYVSGYAKETDRFTVSYNWGKEAPQGQTLPTDSKEYSTVEEAKAAMDKTFTNQTTVTGSKDDKQGTWSFSGWTAEVNENAVQFVGSWKFTENAYIVSYNWGKEAPQGQTLPTDSKEYSTVEEAKAAMDKTFTNQTTVAGSKDGKQGTWSFSGWTAKVNENAVQFVGSWKFTEKAVAPATPTPTEKPNVPEPTATPGITPAPTSTPTEKPNVPEPTATPGATPAPTAAPAAPATGDNSSMMLWLFVALAASGAFAATKVLKKTDE